MVFEKDANRSGFQGASTTTCFLNDNIFKPIVTNVGDDCFILGYPLRNYEGLMLPIWKRGSLASETPLGLEGRPIFLVDAATTAGMSGSPIIRRVVTITADIATLEHYRNLLAMISSAFMPAGSTAPNLQPSILAMAGIRL